ncbi:putative endonuclease 4 [bacterium BMS3Bbin02]|nr:putative endonuclease 4 [bacterium BMS3Bbin02]
MDMLLGAHTPAKNPLSEATARGAEIIQIFLSAPQSYKKPLVREDAEMLKASELPIFVHAPYIINVASPNNRIRIPARKTLAEACTAAERIGASGVIVHGGHVGDNEEVAVGFERWRKAVDSFETTIPILIENTAGGANAVLRSTANYGPLFDELGDRNVGVCLDTCHAWAAGENLDVCAQSILDAVGRIDLLHCNDSKDPQDSRRDRHENLGSGEIPPGMLLACIRIADAPVLLETPGGVEEHIKDLAWLRSRI